MSRAAALWSDFAGKVIDPRAPAVQYTEMRLAFHAGMVAAMAEHRPANPPPSWRRLWDELSEFMRSDVPRLERDRAAAGLSPGDDDAHADCRASSVPGRVDVTRCPEHGRVELWIDGEPFALAVDMARNLGLALVAAAADDRSRVIGKGGPPC